MLQKFLENHILANLSFLLVIIMGVLSYNMLPRQQNPAVNFNWVQVFTTLPGASAGDIETRITDVVEDAIAKVSDIKFVSSTSRPNVSTILVRFDSIDSDTFDKRLSDLRREIQNILDDLPDDATNPEIVEITSSNMMPAAFVMVRGEALDENLQRQTRIVIKDLERLDGVERVDDVGEQDSELQVIFDPLKLESVGVTPSALADTVNAYFRDMAAGSVEIGDQDWLVRLQGTDEDPTYLSSLPILSPNGEIPLRSVADVQRGRDDPTQLTRHDRKPAVMLMVFKKGDANVIDLVQRINQYIQERNQLETQTGVTLIQLDDQTETTRSALRVMENNALLGLLLVLAITWLFLGFKLSFLTVIGIPFILCGTFWFLDILDQTLNTVVLLGIVIALGMLVDDAVVVVESIYYRLSRGESGIGAALNGLREVAAPVTTSVLTTMAAFLPLMLLPGVLGNFMRVTPIVVTCALAVSLIEAFWMLPSHAMSANLDLKRPGRAQILRNKLTIKIRRVYARLLIKSMRHQKIFLFIIPALMILAVLATLSDAIHKDFFASDTARQFYINFEMPTGTSLEKTETILLKAERIIRDNIQPEELRETATVAGLIFTDHEPFFGDHTGQVVITLRPQKGHMRHVDTVIESLRPKLDLIPGVKNISVFRVKLGPPVAKPISIKVRGDDFNELREAANKIREVLGNIEGVTDIGDDDIEGIMELSLSLNHDAVTRAGLNPATVIRDLRLFGDGEVVSSMREDGDKLQVRVRARKLPLQGIDGFLDDAVSLPDGSSISLSKLFTHEITRGKGNIRHYNHRRTITVEADLEKGVIDTVTANGIVVDTWKNELAEKYPTIDLDFSGEMDDITEAINNIAILFLFGIGLIYAILGTQFKSYIQPLIVLTSVPMAFTGVVFGLLFSRNPLSLYTLYGVVALAGIAVNSAIVLIASANEKIANGIPVRNAVIYAARRRVVPILITSMTTIAGLFSLAMGLGGKSLVWGPVASSIVWGLSISTLLTLFVIPLMFTLLSKQVEKTATRLALPGSSQSESIVIRLFEIMRSKLLQKSEVEEFTKEKTLTFKDERIEHLFEEGRKALADKNYTRAIKALEMAVRHEPENGVLNLYAAQSIILYLETYGWDEGYVVRANRYLQRADKSYELHDSVVMLEQILEALKHE